METDIHIRRTHDKEIYLIEKSFDEPKEIFKIMGKLATESGLLKDGSIVCDFGCASGELLYHLSRLFPKAKYRGYDVVHELIERAGQNVPSAEFQIGSVLDRKLIPPDSIDMAFLSGVLQIFDEFETCLSNLRYWTRKGGRVYIFGLFNPFPVDVWVKYRLADDPDPKHREPGWNIFSKVSVSRYLNDNLGHGRHRFIPFRMPFDLSPHQDDVIRSWTFIDDKNRRLFTNGLSMICHQEFLEICP